MAPMDWVYRLMRYYAGAEEQDLPLITATNAGLLSTLFTLLYVIPFYLSASTRPSSTINRDAPSVIKARIRTVTIACIVAAAATLYLLIVTCKADPIEALHLLGWWPINVIDILRSCSLVLCLFLGPLFEKIFIEQDLRDFRGGRQIVETLSSWIGYRNYVAGPVTEELIFRSILIPLHLLAHVSPSRIVFLTPLYFGLAHVHHFYEFRLTHPHTSVAPALLRSIVQFAYTSLFGSFASFLFLRTGSVYLCIIVHAFCNWAGLPRFWGRVRRREQLATIPVVMRNKEDNDVQTAGQTREALDVGWTVVYYALLVAGACGFYMGFWTMTESSHELAKFSSSSR